MKINEHFFLNMRLMPEENYLKHYDEANQRQFDRVAIYHKPKDDDFMPLVFNSSHVRSLGTWKVKSFYRELLLAIDAWKTKENNLNHIEWAIRVRDYWTNLPLSHVAWGCREFKIRDLNAIKKLMEELYTAKELGND